MSVTVVSYLIYTLTSDTAARVGSVSLSYIVAFVPYGVFRHLHLSHRQEGVSSGNSAPPFFRKIWHQGSRQLT